MRIIKPYYVIESKINADEIIQHLEKVGRTCYKSEDKITNVELSKKFIGSLIDRGHEAIIEHASITVRVICDRGVTHEIVRHRLASYAQESTRYCIAGDTKLYFKNPHYDLTIAELYKNKTESQNGSWKRIKIKQLNENTGLFDYVNIKDVYYNGKQKTFKIKTKLGYEIIATKDHEILTKDGFKVVSNLLLNDKIAVNGVLLESDKPLYQNKEWLFYHYNTLNKTSVNIANEFNFNVSTIKKWVKIHQLPKKPLSYWNKNRTPWNKGLTENEDERVYKQGESLRKYHWDEGHSNIRKPKNERIRKLSKRTYNKLLENHCKLCNNPNDLEVHHLDENRDNNQPSNLLTLCKNCHMQLHNKNLKFVYFDEIISITPHETIDVYDLSVDSNFKNYIGNGVVIHNCNYSKDKFDNQLTYIDIMPVIIQRLNPQTDDEKVRLGKIESKILETLTLIEKNYMDLIELGLTPQEARGILPNLLKTEIVMTMNIREWRHFFKLRTSKTAHPQIREIAIPLLAEMKKIVPVMFDDIIVDEKVDVVEIQMPRWSVLYVNGALYAQGSVIPWELTFDLGRTVGKKDFTKTTYILGEKKQKRLNFFDPPLNLSLVPKEIFNQDDKE